MFMHEYTLRDSEVLHTSGLPPSYTNCAVTVRDNSPDVPLNLYIGQFANVNKFPVATTSMIDGSTK